MTTRQINTATGFEPIAEDTVMVIDTSTKDIRLVPWQKVLDTAKTGDTSLNTYISEAIASKSKIGVYKNSAGTEADVYETLTTITGSGNEVKYKGEDGNEVTVTLDKVYDTTTGNLLTFDATKGLFVKAEDLIGTAPTGKVNLLKKSTDDKLQVLGTDVISTEAKNLITEATDGTLEVLATNLIATGGTNRLSQDTEGKLQVLQDGSAPNWAPDTIYLKGTLVTGADGKEYQTTRTHRSSDDINKDIVNNKVLTPSLLVGSEAGENMGENVAISGNGEVMVVGSPKVKDNTASPLDNVGYAAIYVKDEYGDWGLPIILTGTSLAGVSPEAQSKFGSSVAVSEDGSSVVIGAEGHKVSTSSYGAAFLYSSSNNYETPVHTFNPLVQESNSLFGNRVAISDDGTVVAITQPKVNSDAGDIIVFTKTLDWDTGVSLGATHPTAPAADNGVGYNIALSGNGKVLWGFAKGSTSTALHFYTLNNGVWYRRHGRDYSLSEYPNAGESLVCNYLGDYCFMLCAHDTTEGSDVLAYAETSTKGEKAYTSSSVYYYKRTKGQVFPSLTIDRGAKDNLFIGKDPDFLFVGSTAIGTKGGLYKLDTKAIINDRDSLLTTLELPDSVPAAMGTTFSMSDNFRSSIYSNITTGGTGTEGHGLVTLLEYKDAVLNKIEDGFTPVQQEPIIGNHEGSLGLVPSNNDANTVLTARGWSPAIPQRFDIQTFHNEVTWTAPSNAIYMEIEMVGGGGSSGSYDNSNRYFVACDSGRSGDYQHFMVDNIAGKTFKFTAGVGGSAVAVGSQGVNGKDSTIFIDGGIISRAKGGYAGGYSSTTSGQITGYGTSTGASAGSALLVSTHGTSNITRLQYIALHSYNPTQSGKGLSYIQGTTGYDAINSDTANIGIVQQAPTSPLGTVVPATIQSNTADAVTYGNRDYFGYGSGGAGWVITGNTGIAYSREGNGGVIKVTVYYS